MGLPLAEQLVQLKYRVKGSTTSSSKVPLLQSKRIDPYHLTVPLTDDPSLVPFFDADILFFNIPFKRDWLDPQIYQKQIDSVIKIVETSPIQFVIFTSSTAVYPDSLTDAREDVFFVPDNPRAQVLWDIEQSLLNHQRFDATILRLAGLYGPDRPVGRFLLGKTNLNNPQRPVNLIHLDDCVAIIIAIIEQNKRQEIFNLCSDQHPPREVLYTQTALRSGLPPPQFNHEGASSTKIVNNQKIKEALRYSFKVPNPLESN